jgi:branched-chain amino acid transport system permease protein
MRGRPELRTSYRQDIALFNTPVKLATLIGLLILGVALPFVLEDDLLTRLATACVAAIGAIGLGIVTGYAGQVSLGHAFFFGVGTYTAAVIAGDPNDPRYLSLGLDNMLVWLPAAGLVAGLTGVIVAPLASRLRGLYLAVVTLGLVFIGLHVFNSWRRLTGGEGVGRKTASFTVFGFRIDTDHRDAAGAILFTRAQSMYLLALALMVIFAFAARNIARSRVGRAFTAIRDRDIAAGVIGVNLSKYKTIAFGISSFYAGCAGALLYAINGFVNPGSFNLILSVTYIAMVLIGGAGTISGAIAGAFLITLLPKVTEWAALGLTFISTEPTERPNIFQLQFVLYGALVIVFLIFEPRGLYGIWVRVRNYWKSFPFSY